jgi:phosphatidate cytidylyltransferase
VLRAAERDPALRLRVASAAVLAPLILALIALGGWAFALLLAAALVLMADEWRALTKIRLGGDVGAIIAAMVAFGVPLAALVAAARGVPQNGLALLAVGAPLAAMLAWWWRLPPLWIGLGVVYLGLPLIALVWLRSTEPGLVVILWLFAVVWSADIGAYFVGRRLGGPRLAPRISPGKTWSGFLGSILIAALTGLIVALATDAARPVAAATMGAGLAVIAQAGDLAESALKRRAGVKDTSSLIPGHGGLLDRVDGLLFAAPALALAGLLLAPGAWPWR